MCIRDRRRYVANSAYLAALFSLLLTTATGLLCRTILTVMRTPADIFDNAYTYIFIIFMGIPATILYNLLAGILRSLGDSKTPVVFLALSSFLNIFLDFALILWFDAGVAGAAIATVVSQGISGVACLCYMAKKYPILRMSREERRLDIHSCRVLCAMGIPMGLQYSITAIGSIILQSSVNALGSLYVAAVAAGAKLFQLLACPFDAMGATMATYCGQNVGACKLDRLGRGIRSCTALGLGWSLLAVSYTHLHKGAYVLMSGICGSCDFFRDGGTLARREEAHQMGEGLTCPQPVERGLWQSRHCVLVHRRPAGLAPQARQPMVRGWEGAEYALVWDGALTNGPELRRELAEAGFPLDSHDDTETLLAACIPVSYTHLVYREDRPINQEKRTEQATMAREASRAAPRTIRRPAWSLGVPTR